MLLFTEYKATQALVLTALEARFGRGCVGFINGDERLAIAGGAERDRLLQCPRDRAAADFNAGRTRFLISTEAGGEGIDLQERCATLVHVDLPWNPMRLHQRVGRLNRYGQKRPVQVYLLRNPETVEARIWALLQEKLTRIQAALSASMEEAEDISQLVIGMTSSGFFDDLFAEGLRRPSDRLSDWFNAQTAQFGGTDAVAAVRALVGNVARYDFQSASAEIPRLRSTGARTVLSPRDAARQPPCHAVRDGIVGGDAGRLARKHRSARPLRRSRPRTIAAVRPGSGEIARRRPPAHGPGARRESQAREAFFARVKDLSGPLLIAFR